MSRRTYIYDIDTHKLTKGPPLSLPRRNHSSCVIPSEDGTPQYVILIGGYDDIEFEHYDELIDGFYTDTTDILNIKDGKWILGPKLPYNIRGAECVALPPTMKYSCVVIGGSTSIPYQLPNSTGDWKQEIVYRSDVYGLNRSLTNWEFLGTMMKKRCDHIALPLS